MTVRELMTELSLHAPDAMVIVRSDERGFTSNLCVTSVRIAPTDPPIAGIPYQSVGDRRAGRTMTAILVGPPETI